MRIEVQPPFSAATVPWEHGDGVARLSVIAKTMHAMGHAATPFPREAESPVLFGELPHKLKGGMDVYTETDAVPFKPKTDIVLVGSAYAPGGKPVKAMEVSIRVGKIHKALRVIGDRKWLFPTKLTMVPNVTDPEPFTTMPLTYDRAFGGIDETSAAWYPENPTGRGFIGKKTREAVHERPLPNIEDPADPITSWDSRPKLPAGFGFYGRGWVPRRKYAGIYDEKHEKERAPKLPLDFSCAFFNGAHPDLQVEGYLKGDEDVDLRGGTPEGVLRFRLPGIRPRITIARWAVDPMQWIEEHVAKSPSVTLDQIPITEEEVTPVLDTLVFLPDERIFYEVFRAVASLKSLDSLEIARVRVESWLR